MIKYLITVLLISLFILSCTQTVTSHSNEVVSYLEANVATTDPIHSTNKYASTVSSSIFENLLHYHYLKRPIVLETQLAEEMPHISDDGLTYTIKIKRGVFFQDDPAFPNSKGRELIAQDFVYSWMRLADPKNKALGWWLLDGKIKGLNEWRNGSADYAKPIEGLKAIDQYTLQVILNKKSFQFLHVLAAPPLAVVAREVIKKYGDKINDHPVGTGPFKLKSWIRNFQLELVKNDKYHKTFYPKEGTIDSKKKGLLQDSGQTLPLSDKITIRIITERQPLWLSFLKGQVDHGIIPKDNYHQIFENKEIKTEIRKKGIRVLAQKRPDLVYISFNMEHPILGKNKKLRKAISSAIDKKQILKTFYNNRGLIAQGPIPPGLPDYDKTYTNPVSYNLEKAKQLMTEAGYPNGKNLPVFDYDLPGSATWSRQLGEFLKDQLSQIGVSIRIVPNTWPQFDQKVKAKKATLFDQAWVADYPDSENFLQLFYSKNISPGPNSFNFVNSDYDQMFEQFLSLPPSQKRFNLTQKMIKLLNDESPAVFLLHRLFKLPYHSWLKNYNEYPIIYDHLKYLRVDQHQKQKDLNKLKNG